MVLRKERKERRERKETRITRDVRTFVGWKYIEKLVDLSSLRELVTAVFLTGGRASEVLELIRGHFAEFDEYYEVVGMPVFKRYDVIRKYIDPEGKRRWDTELRLERRTFPILKTEPLSLELWKYAQSFDTKDKLFEWKEFKDQYWQVYKVIHGIDAPTNPYAPEHIYPHWLRGQRAAQLRIEYGQDIDQLMRFFGWKSYKTAQHYAGMSSWDLADSMIEGRKAFLARKRKVKVPLPEITKEVKIPPKTIKIEKDEDERERLFRLKEEAWKAGDWAKVREYRLRIKEHDSRS